MYKQVEFNSGGKGLDTMVAQIQGVPTTIAIRTAKGTEVGLDALMDTVLEKIERISKLSTERYDESDIAAAHAIAFEVYEYLQWWEARNVGISRPSNTCSIDLLGESI